MKKVNLLSKAEMKKVMGGIFEVGGDVDGDVDPSIKACDGKTEGSTCTLSGKAGLCIKGGWVYNYCNVPQN